MNRKQKRHQAKIDRRNHKSGLVTRSAQIAQNEPPEEGQIPQDMNYRTISLRVDANGIPETLDTAARSVEIIVASENPVREYCWDRYEFIPTILLMSGCQIPDNRQIPLLDTHMRYSLQTLIGSGRGLAVENDLLVCRAHYSKVEQALGPWQLTQEGHLTDYSVGRKDEEVYFVADGEKSVIDGRTFEGPVKVVTKWIPKEVSACPIGADEFAKARAATVQPATQPAAPKEKNMDPKLRKFLETRGLKAEATEDEAWRFLETLNVREAAPLVPVAPADVDEDALRTEGAAAEQSRILDIRTIGQRAQMDESVISGFVTAGNTVEEVNRAALDHMIDGPAGGGAGHRGTIDRGADESDKFRGAALDSLLIRGGLTVESPAAGHDELTGYSMVEMCREGLRMAGKPSKGTSMDVVGRALTTSDLPVILGEAANRSLLQGYDQAEETFDVWCDDTGSVSDFKTNKIGRASEVGDLDQVNEHGEFKKDFLSEKFEEYAIATYGKILPISRQSIINDDLGALTDVPMKQGESARRKLGDIAYAVLTANAAMSDNVALFHATHKNLGTAGAISEITMAEAIKLMKLQKDIRSKKRLNIQPIFCIAPVALEGSAEIFFNSMQFTGATPGSTRTNVYGGNKFTRVYEPRLDDDSATAWYLAGRQGKTVKMFYLNGQKLPYMEMRTGWNVDGVEFKVRLDAGAKALDWVGMTKNAGS